MSQWRTFLQIRPIIDQGQPNFLHLRAFGDKGPIIFTDKAFFTDKGLTDDDCRDCCNISERATPRTGACLHAGLLFGFTQR